MTTSISDRVTAACYDRSSAMQITISADGRVTKGVQSGRYKSGLEWRVKGNDEISLLAHSDPGCHE